MHGMWNTIRPDLGIIEQIQIRILSSWKLFPKTIRFYCVFGVHSHTNETLHVHVLWLVFPHVLIRCRHTVERKERERETTAPRHTTTTHILCLFLCLCIFLCICICTYYMLYVICNLLYVICYLCVYVRAYEYVCCVVLSCQDATDGELREPLVEAPSGADVQTKPVQCTQTKG